MRIFHYDFLQLNRCLTRFVLAEREKKSLLKKEILNERFVDLPVDLNHRRHRSISVGR